MVKQQTRYLVFFIEPCKQAVLSARAENRKRSNSFHASFHQEKILRRDTCISSSSLYAVCFMNTSNTCKKIQKYSIFCHLLPSNFQCNGNTLPAKSWYFKCSLQLASKT